MFELMPQCFKGIHTGILTIDPKFVFVFVIPSVDSISGSIFSFRSALFVKVPDIETKFFCNFIHKPDCFRSVFDFPQCFIRLGEIFRQRHRSFTGRGRSLCFSFRHRHGSRSDIFSVRNSASCAAEDSSGDSTAKELFSDFFP